MALQGLTVALTIQEPLRHQATHRCPRQHRAVDTPATACQTACGVRRDCRGPFDAASKVKECQHHQQVQAGNTGSLLYTGKKRRPATSPGTRALSFRPRTSAFDGSCRHSNAALKADPASIKLLPTLEPGDIPNPRLGEPAGQNDQQEDHQPVAHQRQLIFLFWPQHHLFCARPQAFPRNELHALPPGDAPAPRRPSSHDQEFTLRYLPQKASFW